MTVTIRLEFYDKRIAYTISGAGIYMGGTDISSENKAIAMAKKEMAFHDKSDHKIIIDRHEFRKAATLDSFME